MRKLHTENRVNFSNVELNEKKINSQKSTYSMISFLQSSEQTTKLYIPWVHTYILDKTY